jgi:hypothetical protein
MEVHTRRATRFHAFGVLSETAKCQSCTTAQIRFPTRATGVDLSAVVRVENCGEGWFRTRPLVEASLGKPYRRDAGATKTEVGRPVAAIAGALEIPGTFFIVRCDCEVMDVYEMGTKGHYRTRRLC